MNVCRLEAGGSRNIDLKSGDRTKGAEQTKTAGIKNLMLDGGRAVRVLIMLGNDCLAFLLQLGLVEFVLYACFKNTINFNFKFI